MTTDIRWKQQYKNFVVIMNDLREISAEIQDKNNLTITEKLALLKVFEFSLEMAKQTLKQYFLAQEGKELTAKEAIKSAFKVGLIKNPDWEHVIGFRDSVFRNYEENALDKSIQQIYELIPVPSELEDNLRDIAYTDKPVNL